jgi:hypothetical protein
MAVLLRASQPKVHPINIQQGISQSGVAGWEDAKSYSVCHEEKYRPRTGLAIGATQVFTF